jgi:hypothetical protein
VLNCSSDEQLKDIEGEYTGGLSVINAIKPILYTWKEESRLTSDKTILGFSAQNVGSVIPEAVSEDAEGYLQLSEFSILAATVNAINELDERLSVFESASGQILSEEDSEGLSHQSPASGALMRTASSPWRK